MWGGCGVRGEWCCWKFVVCCGGLCVVGEWVWSEGIVFGNWSNCF